MSLKFENLIGDTFGGLAAMLVALPSAIAFGLIIYSPLGQGYATRGAIAGIMGAVVIGLIAPLVGGTPKLISAPCAPAAAVLSTFVIEATTTGMGSISIHLIPSLLLGIIALCGIGQVFLGAMGGGRFIKYIPFPVVAGYLSAVGILIITGQFPNLFGIAKDAQGWSGLLNLDLWRWKGLVIGIATMLAMFVAPRMTKLVPATIISLAVGIVVYWCLAIFYPEMGVMKGNSMIVGAIASGESSYLSIFVESWKNVTAINIEHLSRVAVTAVTLSVLLSIDTLKTCVVLDTLTRSRHNSNRELIGQGFANLGSALCCGIPGAGTIGATLVNVGSGARSRFSGVLSGVFSLAVFLVMGDLIAWVPLAALAGILIVVGLRMIDIRSASLLKYKSTVFDFFVSVMVIVAALYFDLIIAAGTGILLSIFIFLRDQARQSVIRRKVFGNQIFSKKRRLPEERKILEKKGHEILAVELQGLLFFGTADQLMIELEPHLTTCRYIILDMRRVHSIDYTAVHRLDQIEQTISENSGYLIFTSVPLALPTGRNVQSYLNHLGLSPYERKIKIFDDLDEGIEWAEDRMLESEKVGSEDITRPLNLSEFSFFSNVENSVVATILSCAVEKKFEPHQSIFAKGDLGGELFFIRKGTVHINMPLEHGMIEHLATFGRGDFFGDIAFLSNGERTANARAEDEVYLYSISRSAFDACTSANPLLGEIVFERLAAALAERLKQTDVMLKTLVEY